MAVGEGEDRRVGGESEKLLTLQEAARRLGLPADDVEAMIRDGSLPSFRLAENLLRIHSRDVELLRARRQEGGARPAPASEPSGSSHSPWERLIDFLYFNDFYLVALLILLTLLAIILAL